MLLSLGEWMNYFGHFHPLFVHLPIGILILVFVLEYIQARSKQNDLRRAISISLAAGFITAVFSCLAGWLLGQDGGYAATTLQLHQWMGISLAAVTGIGWWLQKYAAPRFYRVILAVIFLLLMITGHYGGSLTHGDDYLTAGLPQPVAGWLGTEAKKDSVRPRTPVADINRAQVYADLVMPVLQEKCYSCHSAQKIKGALRLDTETQLMKGGKHGPVVKAGDADASELIKRLLLPAEDDKRMPPKDKEQLTKEEIALLHWWVSAGLPMKQQVAEMKPDSATTQLLHTFASGATTASTPAPLSPVLATKPPAADSMAVQALIKRKVLVSPIAKEQTLLDVSCINATDFTDTDMPLLLAVANNIVFLQAENTRISNAGLKEFSRFTNLVRLNLAGTGINSSGITSLLSLTHLEYINLTGTQLDDAGLMQLAGLPALKKIYAWNTRVTTAGAAAFRTKNPDIQLQLGTE